MKFKNIILATAISILSSSALFPQNSFSVEECPDSSFDSVTFASIGGEMLNVSNLNNALAPAKYPAFSSNMLAVSTGGRTTSLNKIVTGSEGSFSLQSRFLNIGNGYRSYFSTSVSIIGNVGYVVYSTDYIKVYPIVGVGIGRTNLDLYKQENPPTFGEILAKPERGTSLSSINILGDIGLAADYLIKIGKSEKKKGGIVVGLKAGYIFTAYSTGFQLQGENITGSPDINNNGPYIKFFAGYTDGIVAALLDIF